MVASYCMFMFYLIGTSLVTCLQSVDLKSLITAYCIFMFYLIGTSLVTCLQSVDLKSLITAYVIIKPPDLHLDSIFLQ